jgi:hypothetical protein
VTQHDNGHRWEGVAVVPSVVRSRSKPGAEFEPYLPPRSGGAPGPDISYRCPTRGVFRDPHAAAGKDPRILPRTSRSFCHPFLLLQDAGRTQNLRFQSSRSATGGEMAPGRAVFRDPRDGDGHPKIRERAAVCPFPGGFGKGQCRALPVWWSLEHDVATDQQGSSLDMTAERSRIFPRLSMGRHRRNGPPPAPQGLAATRPESYRPLRLPSVSVARFIVTRQRQSSALGAAPRTGRPSHPISGAP